MLVEKLNCASSCKSYIPVCSRLQIGEVYRLEPDMTQSVEPLVPCRTTDNRKVKTRKTKVGVTTEQLQLLLSGAKDFQIKSRVACIRENCSLQRSPKWFPLPNIPEVHNY